MIISALIAGTLNGIRLNLHIALTQNQNMLKLIMNKDIQNYITLQGIYYVL